MSRGRPSTNQTFFAGEPLIKRRSPAHVHSGAFVSSKAGKTRLSRQALIIQCLIHAFNKSGHHLEFSMNDVTCGKIIHVAKMATKDENCVDVDFAVCSYK